MIHSKMHFPLKKEIPQKKYLCLLQFFSYEEHIEYLSNMMQLSLCKQIDTTVTTPHQPRNTSLMNTHEQLGK